MKLLQYLNLASTVTHETRSCRRGDLVDPFTGRLPEGVADGPLDEIVAMVRFNGVESLEIEWAQTEGDIRTLEHDGKSYRVTQAEIANGLWKSIKCERYLPELNQ